MTKMFLAALTVLSLGVGIANASVTQQPAQFGQGYNTAVVGGDN